MIKQLAGSPRLHRRWLSDAIGGAWKLTTAGAQETSEEETPLRAELSALTAQHLSVLIHKRAKYAKDAGRWASELHDFIARAILPQLDEDPALGGVGADELAAILDRIVAAEQQRMSVLQASALPSTQRFEDASWAS